MKRKNYSKISICFNILILFLQLSFTSAEIILPYSGTITRESMYKVELEGYGGYEFFIELDSIYSVSIYFITEEQYAMDWQTTDCLWKIEDVDFLQNYYHIPNDDLYYLLITTLVNSTTFTMNISFEEPTNFQFSNYLILGIPVVIWGILKRKELNHLSLKKIFRKKYRECLDSEKSEQ